MQGVVKMFVPPVGMRKQLPRGCSPHMAPQREIESHSVRPVVAMGKTPEAQGVIESHSVRPVIAMDMIPEIVMYLVLVTAECIETSC